MIYSDSFIMCASTSTHLIGQNVGRFRAITLFVDFAPPSNKLELEMIGHKCWIDLENFMAGPSPLGEN